MKIRQVLTALLLSLVLCSCGGGSGPSAGPPVAPPPPPPAPVEKLGGLWFGEMVMDSVGGSEECGALITEDGQFHFLCVFTDLLLAGTSSRSGQELTGSGIAFSSDGFLDGSFASSLTIQATLISETSLVGTWSTASAGDSGSFDMIYDAEYERPSSLSLLEGVWQATDELGNPVASFTFDNLGTFTAQNVNNCTSMGSILVLDDRYNIYQANSTIVGCPIAGDYSGLSLVSDFLSVNDAMLISINSADKALLVALEKVQ